MRERKKIPDNESLKNIKRVVFFQPVMRWVALILMGMGCWINASVAANEQRALTENSPRQALVLFYTASCPHCQRFAPVLKRYADSHQIPVLAYTLDGGILPDFPDSVTPTLDEVQHFFLNKKPVVPVVFWIDGFHRQIAPVLQGEATGAQLAERMRAVSIVSAYQTDAVNPVQREANYDTSSY